MLMSVMLIIVIIDAMPQMYLETSELIHAVIDRFLNQE
jgi:hypothetical protein